MTTEKYQEPGEFEEEEYTEPEPDPSGKPNPQAFENYDDYVDAVADWHADQKLRQHQVTTPTPQPAGEPQVVDEHARERRETAEGYMNAMKRADAAERKGDSFNAKVARDVAGSYERDFLNIPEPIAYTKGREKTLAESRQQLRDIAAGKIDVQDDETQAIVKAHMREVNEQSEAGSTERWVQRRADNPYGQDLPFGLGNPIPFAFPNEMTAERFDRYVKNGNDAIRTLRSMGLDISSLIHKKEPEPKPKKKQKPEAGYRSPLEMSFGPRF